MEGRPFPLTPLFGFWLGSRAGGKPDGKAEATHPMGSGSSSSQSLSTPGNQLGWWAAGLAAGTLGVWGVRVCVCVCARAHASLPETG